MRALQSLLFSTRLSLSLAWYVLLFSVDYVMQKMWKYRITLATLVVILVVATSWWVQIGMQPQVVTEENIHTNTIEYATNLEKSSFTEAQAREKLDELLRIKEFQPQNRDVLINIALLYDALGEKSNATPYWNAARELDPNHPLFSE